MMLNSHRRNLASERGAVAASAWFGVVIGFGLVAAGVVSGGVLSLSLISFGAALPAFLLQDTLRYVFISRKQPSKTALMDVTWLVVQGVGFVALILGDAVTVWAVTLVWATGALLSCLCAAGTGTLTLSLSCAKTYITTNRWAMSRLTPDAVLNGVSTNAVPVVLAAVGGLTATAALRAGQTLFGPLNMVSSGLTPIITVEAVRDLRRGASQWRLLGVWSSLMAVVGACLGLVIWILPDSWGEVLLGDSWALVPLVLLPLSVQALIRGPFICGPLVLRARHLLDEALRLRLVTTIISLLLPMTGIALGDAEGAAWGLSGAAALNGAAAIWFLRRHASRWGRKLGDPEPGIGNMRPTGKFDDIHD